MVNRWTNNLGGGGGSRWSDYVATPNGLGFTESGPGGDTATNLMSTALGAEANPVAQVNTGGTGTPAPGTQAPTSPDAAAFSNNFYLDNPTSAMNLIMQQMGRSVSSNSPFFSQMQRLAPGLEWLAYLGSGGVDTALGFTGNVNDFMQSGIGTTGGGPFGGHRGLAGLMQNFASGGNTDELSAMIDNMTPEDIIQAMGAMVETANFGSQGSRVTQGIQSALVDEYNKWAGQAGNILGSLADGQTPADAFLGMMRDTGVFDKFW